VATAELKNQLTGQTVEHAMEQYRSDRDPANVTLAKRAVVHFAVDVHRVAMTTRLAGADTRFLPFNRGEGTGAGNPQVEGKQRTSYLWENVWQREAWLDLLARFIHVEQPAKGSNAAPVTIFPRFHQWDAVLKMEADARSNGAGQSYLVQHSAGSGKSNTIAWLSHRLSSLHNSADAKVFDKVIVITDRVVLDRQLQETIYQFEHAHGVVVRIDENAQQLADALAGEQARVIITTLQKFPFVMRHVEELPNRSYAVIVDEAHSSQTGESAKELKKVLGSAGAEDTLVAEELDELGSVAEPTNLTEDLLAAEVLARGRQPNLSFFAFTATPKGKTLELFGRRNPATDPVRGLPRLFDAPGHPGGLHSRRARQLRGLRRTGRSPRQSRTTPSSSRRRPKRRSPVSYHCTITISPRRPRSSSSTSASTLRTASAVRPRR
jgi:type I restriction enzyme R subunit